jgi:hypothetical protein
VLYFRAIYFGVIYFGEIYFRALYFRVVLIYVSLDLCRDFGGAAFFLRSISGDGVFLKQCLNDLPVYGYCSGL